MRPGCRTRGSQGPSRAARTQRALSHPATTSATRRTRWRSRTACPGPGPGTGRCCTICAARGALRVPDRRHARAQRSSAGALRTLRPSSEAAARRCRVGRGGSCRTSHARATRWGQHTTPGRRCLGCAARQHGAPGAVSTHHPGMTARRRILEESAVKTRHQNDGTPEDP